MPILTLIVGNNLLLGFLANEWVHVAMMVAVLAMILISLPQTWLNSRNPWLLGIAISGIACLATSRGFHGWAEVILTIAGSSMIIIAHRMSLKWRCMRTCDDPVTCLVEQGL